MPMFFVDQNGNYYETITEIETPQGSIAVEQRLPPSPSLEEIADDIRAERDRLLTASDWTQVADAPVDQAAWAIYRQDLRDVPEQIGFPENVVWPVQPN